MKKKNKNQLDLLDVSKYLSTAACVPAIKEGVKNWKENKYIGCTKTTKTLLTKQGIKQNAEVQILEDVICLVFLEHYFLPFAAKHPEPKVIGIIRKTWGKMSEAGQQAALHLPLTEDAKALIEKALNID